MHLYACTRYTHAHACVYMFQVTHTFICIYTHTHMQKHTYFCTHIYAPVHTPV